MSVQDVKDIRAAGPELGQFVSDYVAIFRENGEPMLPRRQLEEGIAEAYVENAVSARCPDDIAKAVRDDVLPEIRYILT